MQRRQLYSCSPSASPRKWLRLCAIDTGEALQLSSRISNTVAATFGGLQRLDVATSCSVSSTMKCPHPCDATASQRWATYGQEDENELVFPNQPPQQERASLSRTRPKPKTHGAAAVADLPSPPSSSRRHRHLHLRSAKSKKVGRKQVRQLERATATTSAAKMLQNELPFVSKDGRQQHKDDDDRKGKKSGKGHQVTDVGACSI